MNEVYCFRFQAFVSIRAILSPKGTKNLRRSNLDNAAEKLPLDSLGRDKNIRPDSSSRN